MPQSHAPPMKDGFMNIHNIIKQQLNNDHHKFRMLSDDPVDGVISVGYIEKQPRHQDWVNRNENRYDLVLVLSGTGVYKDAIVGEVPLSPGKCIQRMPGRRHSTLIYEEGWSELYLCLGPRLFNSLHNIYAAARKPVLDTGIDFEMIQLYLDMHKQLDLATGVELPLLLPKATELITRAAYLHRVNSRTSEEAEILKMSVAYIQANISNRLTVEEVADHVAMGYEKFRKLFQQSYGISPGNFILNQRLRAAQSMLSKEEVTIKEIALNLGYRDSAAFSKQFKKVIGRTPTEFRELYRV